MKRDYAQLSRLRRTRYTPTVTLIERCQSCVQECLKLLPEMRELWFEHHRDTMSCEIGCTCTHQPDGEQGHGCQLSSLYESPSMPKTRPLLARLRKPIRTASAALLDPLCDGSSLSISTCVLSSTPVTINARALARQGCTSRMRVWSMVAMRKAKERTKTTTGKDIQSVSAD